ncbi:fibronectin type III domain-containing protein, partial [Flavobacterium longum]|uniref:fibronectin type III domain-containing protein n=1 Tax=Flavobacterium longum TaxID=1299340 RepID=UPI0039E7AC65
MKKTTLLILTLLLSLAGFAQPAFKESFESATPPAPVWDLGTTGLGSNGQWAIFDNGVGPNQSWTINTAVTTPPTVCDGVQSAYINRENIGALNTSQDFLATPLITIPANGQLRFLTRTTLTGDQGTKYKIMWAPASAAQNNPAAYTLIQEFSESTLVAVFNVCEEKAVSLSTVAGQQGYIAFVREYTQPDAALSGDRWLVDNVRIDSQCIDPSALAAGLITQSSAQLSWTAGAGQTQWEIAIVSFEDPLPASGTLISDNPYTATTTLPAGVPFTPSTQYKYWVRAVCQSTFTSEWIGPFAFTMSSPGLTCASPIVVDTLPYCTTDNTANYSDSTDAEQPDNCAGTTANYMTGNDVFYSYTPTTTGAISISMTPTATFSGIFVYDGCANVGVECVAGVANSNTNIREIASLTVEAGHQYIIVISTNATPQTTGYTLCIQQLNCAPPNALSAVSTGPTSANLSWGNPGGASSWEVFVQTPGSSVPTTPGVTANTNTNFGVTELTADSIPLTLGCYQYWVRAACGDGTFSPWAGPYQFCTTTCTSGCNYSLVMTDTFGDGWNGNTMTLTQGVSTTTIGPTFTDGEGPVTIPVTLCDGDFTLTWNTGGNFAGEVGVSIVNNFGQTIFTHTPGTNLQGQVLYTGTVDCATPACLPPTTLTSVSSSIDSVTVSWAPGGPETAWQVIAVPDGDPAPSATDPGWLDAPFFPFTIPGLAAGSNYDVYIRAVCSPIQTSPAAGPLNVVTSVCEAAQQCLYTFTMVDSFGDGWNGNTMSVIQNGVVVATLTGPTNADDQNPVTVQVALCNGIPFNLFWNTGGTFANEVGITITSFLGEVLFTLIPGPGQQGQTLYEGTGECVPPTCLKPTNVVVSGITLDSAIVTWQDNNTPAATQWEIIVLPASDPAPLPTVNGTLISTNPYTLTGLNPATQYTVYVRAVCSDTDSSFWSLGTDFNTVVCLPNNLCEYTFVMVDSFGDSWNGNTMTVSQNGIVMATLTGPTNADDQNPISVIVPLCNNIPFELFWNTGGNFANEVGVSIVNTLGDTIFNHAPGDGNLQGQTLFEGTVTCVPVTCPKPVQLTATQITSTTALLGWTESGTATQWEILVVPFGTTPPVFADSGTPAGVNPILITGLTPGAQYTFYVRAICSDTDESNWSAAFNFNTLPANDECTGAIMVPVNSNSSCNQSVIGTVSGATASSQINSCAGASDDDVWFQFVASELYHNVSLSGITNGADLNFAVYSGDCGTLTLNQCYTDTSGAVNNLVPGNTYFIRVWSTSDTPINSSFTLCVTTQSNCENASNACSNTQYTNTTGVTNLGQIGCLFTSPNPRFFIIEIIQNGPINYFIQQSTTPGGPPDLDVDYVAWGPFTDPDVMCNGIPLNGAVPLTGLTTGCSYSAAPTETFNIANGQIGQFYVLLVTNFSDDPGYITMTQTNANQPGAGEMACCPEANFTYPSNSYCTTDANPTPTVVTGSLLGTFSALPAGLVFVDTATGQIDLAASAPGVYVVRNTLVADESCDERYFDFTITISAPVNATISYPAPAAYCSSDTNLIPINFSGTTGGNYSASPFGLFIDPLTGTVNPSLSAAGVYTVSYNILSAGACAAVQPTTTIEIIAAPNVGDIADVTVCDSYTLPALTVGNYYDGPGGTGTMYNANDVISSSMTMYVYATNNNCTDEDSFAIVINATPVLDPVSNVTSCTSYFLPALNVGNYYTGPGGTGTQLAANTEITTDQTIYVYAANGLCTAEASFTITFGALVVTNPGDQTVCDSYTLPVLAVGNYFTGAAGTGQPLNAGDAITSTQLIYVYGVSGTCTDEASFTVTVNTAAADVIGNQIVCNSYTLPALSANNTYWTQPGGTGTQLFANDVITTNQTIYIYAQSGTTPNCTAESSFTVSVGSITADILNDVTVCDSYVLPALSADNSYWTGTNGTGTQLFPGGSVTSSQTIYIWASLGACSDQSDFVVTVNQ